MRRVIKGLLLGGVCARGLLVAGPLFAQVSASDKVVAETLFDEGVKLLRAGKLTEACPKFEQSQRIDSAVGTLLYLAECYERTGRTASAWATYREAASAASASGQASRALVGDERARKLEPTLSRVTFIVASQNDMPGFELRKDGKPVSRAVFSVPIPLDPGEHTIAARAPGYEPFEVQVLVSTQPEHQTINIPPLKALPQAAEPSPAPAPAKPGLAVAPPPPPPPLDSGAGQRTWGLVAGAVGLVGVGAGAWFGLDANSKDDDASKSCDGARCSSKAAEEISDQAQDSALIANICYGVGAAGLISGVVLYLTAGDTAEAGPSNTGFVTGVSTDGASLAWKGSF